MYKSDETNYTYAMKLNVHVFYLFIARNVWFYAAFISVIKKLWLHSCIKALEKDSTTVLQVKDKLRNKEGVLELLNEQPLQEL